MKYGYRLIKVGFLITTVLLVMFLSGCEYYRSMAFTNQTSIKIGVNVVDVPLAFAGDLHFLPPDDFIQPGEFKKYVTAVSKYRVIDTKYAVVALNEKGEVLYLKYFTWDQLHDLNWTVEIKP